LGVDGPACVAQIGPSIVRPDAVDVIYFMFRPFARHVQPRQAMGVKTPGAIYTNENVPKVFANVPEFSAHGAIVKSGCCVWVSPKFPGFWVVAQTLAQTLCGKIGLSHDALLMLIGQRPASADNASGLRYFSARGA
jgi:hypothetical protein